MLPLSSAMVAKRCRDRLIFVFVALDVDRAYWTGCGRFHELCRYGVDPTEVSLISNVIRQDFTALIGFGWIAVEVLPFYQ